MAILFAFLALEVQATVVTTYEFEFTQARTAAASLMRSSWQS